MAAILRAFYYLVCWILFVISLPFLLSLSLIFRIYRSTLVNMIQRKTKGSAQMVGGSDSAWLQESDTNLAIIHTLIKLKGKPDLKNMRTVLTERLVNARDEDTNEEIFAKAKSYPTRIYHRYVWVKEDNFDLNDHVFLHPEPMPTSKEHLQEMLGGIISKPFPKKTSQWQFILIGSEDPDCDYYYAVFRVHHSIADGISLVRMIVSRVVDNPPEMATAHRYATKNKYKKMFSAIFKGPGILIERITWPKDNNILHGPSITGDKLLAWSHNIDLNLVKQMKNATNSTVNDILVSCLAGTLQTYFKKHSSTVPKTILSYVPIDVRPPKDKLVLDNQFALAFLELPLEEQNGIDRLKENKRRMNEIKTSPEPIVTSLALKYFMSRYPNWFTSLMFDWTAGKSSMVFTNVPGPQERLQLAGDELEEIIFWPPQRHDVGLGISILSYAGHVRFGVQVDRGVMSNPNVLVKEFESNFVSLAKEIGLDVNIENNGNIKGKST